MNLFIHKLIYYYYYFECWLFCPCVRERESARVCICGMREVFVSVYAIVVFKTYQETMEYKCKHGKPERHCQVHNLICSWILLFPTVYTVKVENLIPTIYR